MRIVKGFSWAMAHRLGQGYSGKCQNLHGHTYRCEVVLGSDMPDRFGMVIDFGQVKTSMEAWVNEYLDHATLVTADDKALEDALIALGSRTFAMPARYHNTTAENIANMLFWKFLGMAHNLNVSLITVRVWETETAYAEFTEGDKWHAN